MRKILILLISIIVSNNLFSQAGSFNTVQLDARSVAMGNTYISGSTSNGIFTNLAASRVGGKKVEVNLSYKPWIENLSSDYNLGGISAYYALNAKSSLAVGAKQFSMPSYMLTDDNGNSSGTYDPSEYLIAFGYAYKITKKSAFSISMQYLKSNLSNDENASTVFFDLGFKSSYKNFGYGFVVKNLGSKLKFINSSVQLPLTVGGGIDYCKSINDKHSFTGNVDVSHISLDNNSGISTGLGLEYNYKNTIALRTGYHAIDETIGLSSFSLGGGVKLKGVSLDFSWLIADNALKNNYAISCSWSLY